MDAEVRHCPDLLNMSKEMAASEPVSAEALVRAVVDAGDHLYFPSDCQRSMRLYVINMLHVLTCGTLCLNMMCMPSNPPTYAGECAPSFTCVIPHKQIAGDLLKALHESWPLLFSRNARYQKYIRCAS